MGGGFFSIIFSLVSVYKWPVWRRIPIYLLQKANKSQRNKFLLFYCPLGSGWTSERSTNGFQCHFNGETTRERISVNWLCRKESMWSVSIQNNCELTKLSVRVTNVFAFHKQHWLFYLYGSWDCWLVNTAVTNLAAKISFNSPVFYDSLQCIFPLTTGYKSNTVYWYYDYYFRGAIIHPHGRTIPHIYNYVWCTKTLTLWKF